MRTIDRTFGWLLVIASLMHSAGSYMVYQHKPELLLWSEAAGLAGLLLAGLNLLRAGRPLDRALGWVSFAGCLGWLAVAFGFGVVVGNLLDPRLLVHVIVTLVLAFMSLRTAMRKAADEKMAGAAIDR